MIVFLSDAQTIESFASLWKFSTPTTWNGLLPSHSRKASANAHTIGTSVKTANPIKFGAINEYATRVRFLSRAFLPFFNSTEFSINFLRFCALLSFYFSPFIIQLSRFLYHGHVYDFLPFSPFPFMPGQKTCLFLRKHVFFTESKKSGAQNCTPLSSILSETSLLSEKHKACCRHS